MKVVILCGGKGTRLAEETKVKPKPMVKIGNKPILSHIIKFFNNQGFTDIILATGYKGQIIKNYYKKNKNILVVDTGKNTLTGGRLLKLSKYLKNEKFFMTYGDGLADINLNKLLQFHQMIYYLYGLVHQELNLPSQYLHQADLDFPYHY